MSGISSKSQGTCTIQIAALFSGLWHSIRQGYHTLQSPLSSLLLQNSLNFFLSLDFFLYLWDFMRKLPEFPICGTLWAYFGFRIWAGLLRGHYPAGGEREKTKPQYASHGLFFCWSYSSSTQIHPQRTLMQDISSCSFRKGIESL